MPLNCHQSYQRGVLVIAFMITTNVFLFSPSSFPSSIIFLLSLSPPPLLALLFSHSHSTRDLTINVSSSSICLFVSLVRGVEINLPSCANAFSSTEENICGCTTQLAADPPAQNRDHYDRASAARVQERTKRALGEVREE